MIYFCGRIVIQHDIWSVCWWNLTKLSPLMDVGARMNVLNFGVKRSSVKFMMGSNIP